MFLPIKRKQAADLFNDRFQMDGSVPKMEQVLERLFRIVDPQVDAFVPVKNASMKVMSL